MAEMVKSFLSGEGTETPSSSGAYSGGVGERSGASFVRPPGETGDVKQAVSEVAGQARGLVSQQVTERAGRSATDIDQVARALRQTREQLGGNVAAPYVDKAAQQLERLSSYLRTADAKEIVRGAESFARREPLLFLGGAFAVGLLAARFLKSSAHHEGSEREHSGAVGPAGPDPRNVARREYPQAVTEPRGDVSHSAEGPGSEYTQPAGGVT